MLLTSLASASHMAVVKGTGWRAVLTYGHHMTTTQTLREGLLMCRVELQEMAGQGEQPGMLGKSSAYAGV